MLCPHVVRTFEKDDVYMITIFKHYDEDVSAVIPSDHTSIVISKTLNNKESQADEFNKFRITEEGKELGESYGEIMGNLYDWMQTTVHYEITIEFKEPILSAKKYQISPAYVLFVLKKPIPRVIVL